MLNSVCQLAVFNPLMRTTVPENMLWGSATVYHDPVDDIGMEVRAALAMKAVQSENPAPPDAVDFIQSHRHDNYPDSYPGWQMMEDLWAEIIAHPASGMILKELLYGEEYFRVNYAMYGGLNPQVDVLWQQMYLMIKTIADAATAELALYEALVAEEEAAEKRGEKVTISLRGKRPADIYRRYGAALLYATQNLGSFQAKEALNGLRLSVTIPEDELLAPAWVDGYTGAVEQDYEILRVRDHTADLSSDGNLPATLADLMENLGDAGRESFGENLKSLGMDLSDYWRQFIQAQRSGFTMAPEPEETAFDDDTDSIEKDFEFKADLTKDNAAVDAIRKACEIELRGVRELMSLTAQDVARVREAHNRLRDLTQLILAAYERGLSEFMKHPAVEPFYRVLWDTIDLVEYNIRMTQSVYARDFPDGLVRVEREMSFLPFKYPIDPKKTSLGYLHDLLEKKIEKLFAVTWDMARARFFTSRPVKDLIWQFNEWAMKGQYEPKDLMTVLLPYQNAFGFREDEADEYDHNAVYDLQCFRVPHEWGVTLHGFLENFGDAFLDQFLTGGGAGIQPSQDPSGYALEVWTNDLVAERKRVYLSPKAAKLWRKVFRETEGTTGEKKAAADKAFDAAYTIDRSAEVARIKALGLKPNNRNLREFIEAEVEAALLGDGGQNGPQQAGWDAYRNKVDPRANREYKKVLALTRKAGKSWKDANQAAMIAFWEAVDRNRNAIDHPTKNGLVLRSGRAIDWGITKLKLQKGELVTDATELKRLLRYLEVNRFAGWFQPFLKQHIARLEEPEGEKVTA